MGRYCHHGTASVSGKDVIGNPNRYSLAAERVNGIAACENTAHFLHFALSLSLAAVLGKGNIFFNLLLAFGACESRYHFMLRTKHHEGNSEDCIGSCREYFQGFTALGLEIDTCSAAFAYPVSLYLFYGVRPIQIVQAFEQPLCVCCYPQTPLTHLLSFDRVASSDAYAVHDFIVGEYRTQFAAPVDHGVGQISQTIVHKHVALLLFGEAVPLFCRECLAIGVCGVYSALSSVALLGEDFFEFGNWTCFLRIVAIITAE